MSTRMSTSEGSAKRFLLEPFECRRCGRCCTGEGYVNVSREECEEIASHLRLSFEDFAAAYTIDLSPYLRRLVDAEGEDQPCVFLRRGADGLCSCAIHTAKPSQCRDFPSKWRPEDAKQWCAGLIGNGDGKDPRS